MSMTPAFSPGPWITQGALVGSPRRCTLEDLYEQCSFHIAEKMPSSVIVGSRPMRSRIRRYSSGLRPCSATSSGVMRGSLGITGGRLSFLPSLCERRSCRVLKMLNQATEQPAPVGRAECSLHVVLGMRHHAGHIAALV